VHTGLWLIGTDGSAVPVRGLRGFDYIRALLRHPNLPIGALDLAGDGTGSVDQPGIGEILDRQALAAYRNRIRSLDEEIAEADEWSDVGRAEMLRSERDAILHELAAATGLGGRGRTTGSTQERARIAVRKAINAAIERIEQIDAGMGRHLATTIHTGSSCVYQPVPDDSPIWTLDRPGSA
jgi:hypothetical protein